MKKDFQNYVPFIESNPGNYKRPKAPESSYLSPCHVSHIPAGMIKFPGKVEANSVVTEQKMWTPENS